MKIIFEAFDGTQFENEDDCKQYEENHNLPLCYIIDENRRLLPTRYNVKDCLDYIQVIVITRDKEVKKARELFKTNFFQSVGVYRKDFDNSWRLMIAPYDFEQGDE